MPIERVPTGIYGLDELLEGGFPTRRTILVSGACGTGKSIFSMQFIYRGALEYGEAGVFVTFDELPEKLREDMSRFGWNIPALEGRGKLAIIDATSARAGAPSEEERALMPGELDFDAMLRAIATTCRSIGARRLVIDSIPGMAFQVAEKEADVRRAILKLSFTLARIGLTSIITSEIPEQPAGAGIALQFSKYGVEEYIADGVVVLGFLGVGTEAMRTLHIRKMRGTRHSQIIHPLHITDKGIEIKRIEEVFK